MSHIDRVGDVWWTIQGGGCTVLVVQSYPGVDSNNCPRTYHTIIVIDSDISRNMLKCWYVSDEDLTYDGVIGRENRRLN
jgi:hypothetical protein